MMILILFMVEKFHKWGFEVILSVSLSTTVEKHVVTCQLFLQCENKSGSGLAVRTIEMCMCVNRTYAIV